MKAKDPNIDFQTFSFSLANGASRQFRGPYNYFRIMEMNGSDEITVKFQDGSKQNVPVSVGIGFPDSKGDEELDEFWIFNDSGSSVTGKISIAAGGEIQDSRATIGGTVSIKETADTIKTGTATGTGSITPEAGSKSLTVYCTASTTFGNDGAALNFTVPAGGSYTFKTTDVIYYNGTFSYIEEYDA